MKPPEPPPSHGFSLPVLLSFNELAWIAIFGIGLFSAFLFQRSGDLKIEVEDKTKEVERLGRELADTKAGGEAEREAAAHREARLRQQLADATETTHRLQADLAKAIADKAALVARIDELTVRKAQLESEVNASLAEIASVRAELEKVADALKLALKEKGGLAAKNDGLAELVKKINERLMDQERSEFFLRQELIGIQGRNLRRVVVLFDSSETMRRDPVAWKGAKELVHTWLRNLPVEECVLINFDTTVNAYPKDGSFLRLRNPDQTVVDAERKKLLDHFESIKGGELTDTHAALERAYSYTDVSMILLFTDGEPVSRFNPGRQIDEIYALVRREEQKRRIPINTVGLGLYESIGPDDAKAGYNKKLRFLRQLSTLTGGSFMARGTVAPPQHSL